MVSLQLAVEIVLGGFNGHKPINSSRNTPEIRSDAFPKDAGEKKPAVLICVKAGWSPERWEGLEISRE